MIKTELLLELKDAVASLAKEKKRYDRMSEKRRLMSPENATPKRIQNAEADLNWAAADIIKMEADLHAVCVDCGLAAPKDNYEPIELRPSSFHTYNYQPRIPICKQS